MGRGRNREVLIVSVASDGRYAVHPPDRRPDRYDPVFATLPEAEAFLAGGLAAQSGARFEVDPAQDDSSDGNPADGPVELLTVQSSPVGDGSLIVTGVVEGTTMRATCRGPAIDIDPRDLEDSGIDLNSERAHRLIFLWTDFLARRIEDGDLLDAAKRAPGESG